MHKYCSYSSPASSVSEKVFSIRDKEFRVLALTFRSLDSRGALLLARWTRFRFVVVANTNSKARNATPHFYEAPTFLPQLRCGRTAGFTSAVTPTTPTKLWNCPVTNLLVCFYCFLDPPNS